MVSLTKLKTLTPYSTDDEVYAVYQIPKSVRQYNPVKDLRRRVPFDIAAKTKKRAGQYIQFDLYVQYQPDDCDDPTVSELSKKIKLLKSMDNWPKQCPTTNKLCQNYRANIKGYETQLGQIKKHGPKRNKYKKYSAKELKSLFLSLDFIGILKMIAPAKHRLSIKYTPNSIRSVEKVTSAFLKQYQSLSLLDSNGPVYRLRCKCIVIGQKSCMDSAQKIMEGVELFEWRLHNNIARSLSDAGHPYRGGFDILGQQIHDGQTPAMVGQHVTRVSPV